MVFGPPLSARESGRPEGHDALADPARLHLLAETGLVEASVIARLPTLDRVARLAAHATRSALAQVNLVTADAQVPAAAYVDEAQPGPRGARLDAADADLGGAWRTPVGLDASYCQQVVRRGAALVVDDAQHDPLVSDNRATREAGIGAYASVPLVTPGGYVLGTVCVVEFHTRQWSSADVAALTECAALAGEEIAARLGASQALRESEQRLRFALQAASLGAWSLELRGDVLTASAQCRAHFGRTEDEPFRHADLLASIHPGDRARVERERRDAVASRADYATEYRVRLRDGEQRWLAEYGHPLQGAGGVPLRIVGLVQDITERHADAAERERLLDAERAARADAEHANRAKSEFLAVMSHELRTPLNAIDGYAELMELGIRGPVTPEQREDLRRMRVSQKRLLGLINEMLNYTRLESGTVQYATEPVAICTALTEAEELVAPQMRAKGLTFTVQACDDGIAASADREKVHQIIANLLSNAVKFTRRGGHVAIGCDDDGSMLRVRVTDTGIGIPADKLQAIFDPFVQVDSSLTREQEGVGLGLAISRDLARGMGGDLTAESTPGEGSVFTLVLPRALAE